MSIEAMKQALEALENTYALRDDVIGAKKALEEALAKQEHGSPEDMYVEMHKHLNCPYCGGSGHIDDVKQEQGEPVAWPVMNTEEREALERFNETCEDGQEYDVSKSMMKHLAELGVVYSAGFGRYGFTEFGRVALNHPQPAQQKDKQEQGEPVAVKVDDATTGTQYVKFLVDECLIPIGAKFYTTPQPVAEPHNGEPVAGPSGDFLSDFKNGQWWLAELDSTVANGTPDQKRAVSVVRNLLATVAANTTPQQRKPLTDEQIDEIIDSPADVRALITDARGKLRLFARAVEAAHGIKE